MNRSGQSVAALARFFKIDAEALLVDPRDGSMVIVTKERKGPSLIYQVDALDRTLSDISAYFTTRTIQR